MGGKKGGGEAQIEVTKYFMSQHFGVCAGADAIKRIKINEKTAWEGTVTALNTFVIDKPSLFGGSGKEGGAEGVVYWLPGDADQVLPDVLARKLGRAGGSDAPGYRGIASIFMVGPAGTPHASYGGWGDQTKGKAGFYWSANNPYLPDVWVTVKRAPKGLNPDYAIIGDSFLTIAGTIEVAWQQNTFEQPGGNDEARMGIAFYDEEGEEISTVWSDFAQPIGWTARSISAECPAGTKAVGILMGFQRLAGTNNDGYIDSIAVTLDGAPLAMTNLGAELGSTAGWVNDAGALAVRSLNPEPHSGAYYFCGGVAAETTARQMYSVAVEGTDANPAHIIYECLTDTDWGMGSPATAIDTDSFEAAGITLFYEFFGLSMLWTRQASIQDFIQEVLDHIQAVLFVDPATGLLTLKLIRGDYDVETLPDINPDNADLSSFSRKLWGEITNEIVVTWTNPENEQEETVTVQDLASIATQGGIISDSRNYYGVRNAELAAKLANRDLRTAGQPLATFEVEVDRTFWAARPGTCATVTWPEYGLAGVVARVTSVDYGKPGDPTIKLQMIEDVWGLDFGDYVAPPTSGWEDPAEDPAPLTIERVFTLPLFFAANTTASQFGTAATYPQVLAGILGTTTQEDAYQAELWDEVTLSNGSLEWQQIGTLNIIGHGDLEAGLAAEAESTAVTFENLIGDTAPALAGFVIIGDDGEGSNEIAQFDAIGDDYTLRRGVLDTVPRAWPAGTPAWFVDGSTLFEDTTIRSAGEVADYKLLTGTSKGMLSLGDAALVSATLSERPWLPNRPANVAVDGVLFNTATDPVDMTGRADPWVTISWANRNRLLEDSQVLAWDDATVDPEDGQTTTIEVLADDGSTVLDTITGLTGTSHDVPDASFGTESLVLIRPKAVRTDADGTFESLQAHGVWVQVAPSRVTETGETRLTEGGERRELED